jgi:hypothetical protein
MSAITMSGEASLPRPADTRGLTTGRVHVAVDSPAKTETINAAQQPAAIIAQSLERLNAAGGEKVMGRAIGVAAGRTAVESDVDVDSAKPVSLANPSMSKLADQTQAQMASVAEIAVLAQANQLPNDAMAFSTSA